MRTPIPTHQSDTATRVGTPFLHWKDYLQTRFCELFAGKFLPMGDELLADASAFFGEAFPNSRLRVWYDAGETVRGALEMAVAVADGAITHGVDSSIASAVRASAKAIARAHRPQPIKVEVLLHHSREGAPRASVTVDGKRVSGGWEQAEHARQQFLQQLADFNNAGGTWEE